MGPRLSSWNFSSVDRCPKIAGAREELSPAQIRDKRPRIPHSSRLHVSERLLEGQKGRGHTP